MQSIITVPTVGVTCCFAGIYAPPAIWVALGLTASTYTNTAEGCVRETYRGTDAYEVIALLETARDQLGSGATDEQILRRACALRYALLLARAGQSVEHRHGGMVDHVMSGRALLQLST